MTTRKKSSSTSKRARTTKSESGPRARGTRTTKAAAPVAEEIAAPIEALAPEPVDEPEPAPLPITTIPEPSFAARWVPPAPAAPPPPNRRAVFFDVENTSRPEHVESVLRHLTLDRFVVTLDLIAVGNWRVIGHDTARILARRGAQLVHSAPSVGVRDWSDLRIAVGAGVWLAGARPGDQIDIVSDDQAFDAVGDVAASLGVAFRRMSYRTMAGLARDAVVEEPASAAHGRRSRRGGRRRRGGGARPQPMPMPTPVVAAPPALAAPNGGRFTAEEPHTAPHDEIVAVVRELMATVPAGRGVSIDLLSNALKSRGFSRPPGSPRLITRLRRIKQLDVGRSGVITLLSDEQAPEPTAPVESALVFGETELEPFDVVLEPAGDGGLEPGAEPTAGAEGEGANRPRRRRRRGGRRRRGRNGGPTAVATP